MKKKLKKTKKKAEIVESKDQLVKLTQRDVEELEALWGVEKAEQIIKNITKLQTKAARLEAIEVALEEKRRKEEEIKKQLVGEANIKKLKREDTRYLYYFAQPYHTRVLSNYKQEGDFTAFRNAKGKKCPYWAGYTIEFTENGPMYSLKLAEKKRLGKDDKTYELPVCHMNQILQFISFDNLHAFKCIFVNRKPDGAPMPVYVDYDPNVVIANLEPDTQKIVRIKLQEFKRLDGEAKIKVLITAYQKNDNLQYELGGLKKQYEEMLEDRNIHARLVKGYAGRDSRLRAQLSQFEDMLMGVSWEHSKLKAASRLAELQAIVGEEFVEGVVSRIGKIKKYGKDLLKDEPMPKKDEDMDIYNIVKKIGATVEGTGEARGHPTTQKKEEVKKTEPSGETQGSSDMGSN